MKFNSVCSDGARHAGQEPKTIAAKLRFQTEEMGVQEANLSRVLRRRLCLLVCPLMARLHPCSTPCDGDGARLASKDAFQHSAQHLPSCAEPSPS